MCSKVLFALKAQLFASFFPLFFACGWHRSSAWVGKGPQVPAEHHVRGAAPPGSYICIIKLFHSSKLMKCQDLGTGGNDFILPCKLGDSGMGRGSFWLYKE